MSARRAAPAIWRAPGGAIWSNASCTSSPLASPRAPTPVPATGAGRRSYVDRLGDLSRAWTRAQAGLADSLPLYAFTTSALDDTVALLGRHPVYLACSAAPASVDGGWRAQTELPFVEAWLDTVKAPAPAFRDSVVVVSPFTPDLMAAGGGWFGAHPVHPDIALDQLGPLRPTRALGSPRRPSRVCTSPAPAPTPPGTSPAAVTARR